MNCFLLRLSLKGDCVPTFQRINYKQFGNQICILGVNYNGVTSDVLVLVREFVETRTGKFPPKLSFKQ